MLRGFDPIAQRTVGQIQLSTICATIFWLLQTKRTASALYSGVNGLRTRAVVVSSSAICEAISTKPGQV